MVNIYIIIYLASISASTLHLNVLEGPKRPEEMSDLDATAVRIVTFCIGASTTQYFTDPFTW